MAILPIEIDAIIISGSFEDDAHEDASRFTLSLTPRLANH